VEHRFVFEACNGHLIDRLMRGVLHRNWTSEVACFPRIQRRGPRGAVPLRQIQIIRTRKLGDAGGRFGQVPSGTQRRRRNSPGVTPMTR